MRFKMFLHLYKAFGKISFRCPFYLLKVAFYSYFFLQVASPMSKVRQSWYAEHDIEKRGILPFLFINIIIMECTTTPAPTTVIIIIVIVVIVVVIVVVRHLPFHHDHTGTHHGAFSDHHRCLGDRFH